MKKAIITLSILCGGLLVLSPITNTTFAQSSTKNSSEIVKNVDKNSVEVIDILNQDQARELLEMYKEGVNYAFQGDENTFETLSQKGMSGYVFLPDYETDLGFFVDKNTASIYYFHPSGYLELAL